MQGRMDRVPKGGGRGGRGPQAMRKIVTPQRGAGIGDRPSRKNRGIPLKETALELRARKVASSGAQSGQSRIPAFDHKFCADGAE